MNLWLKHVDEFVLVAPFKNTNVNNIDSCYEFDAQKFVVFQVYILKV